MNILTDTEYYLNDYELNLLNNKEVLLTKNRIIQKIISRFAKTAEEYKSLISSNQLNAQILIDPKISKGENYKGLPYVMLDYPRQFAKEDTFAIRSLFWWGNFFSITLQLRGKYLQKFSAVIEKSIELSLFEGWFIGCGSDPWQHHFEEDNYLPVFTNAKNNILSADHLKLAKKIPLDRWDDAEDFFIKNFTFLLEVLNG